MRHSSRALVFTLALFIATSGSAIGQNVSSHWNPRSGDAWVDMQLADINQYASRYRDPFVDEMQRYYDAPRNLVSDLLIKRQWAPGDVYYACAIARIIGRPCRDVADEWERDRGLGWGAVAKRLGIKPGSAEFHRLKRGFVPTYDRWARPLVLDRELRRDFPERGTKSEKALPPGQAKKTNARPDKGFQGDAHGAGKNSKGNNSQGRATKENKTRNRIID